MSSTPRIGIQIDHAEPYWVQVREALKQQGRSRSVEIVELAIPEAYLLSVDEQIQVVENFVVQDLHALICNAYPQTLMLRLLERGFPLVCVAEHGLRHPRLVSRTGLFDAAALVAALLEARLPARAEIFVVGGETHHAPPGRGDGEDIGQSRIDGFVQGLSAAHRAALHYVPCLWMRSYEEARHNMEAYLRAHPPVQVDAIYGLSDSLALGALDACQALGRRHERTAVLGINGDPLALAAISAGKMTATVDVDLDDLVNQALDLALRAAAGQVTPALFSCRQQLVTGANVAEAATRKLISLAALPTHLIEDMQRHAQQRALQLETSEAIDRKVGLLLDEQQLSQALTSLIRDSYGFDHARFLRLDPEAGRLVPPPGSDMPKLGVAQATGELAGPLAYALANNQLVFIPDTAASQRFAPDAEWPETQARIVAPVQVGSELIGVLDLHSNRVKHHTHEELAGLQLLASRFGITVRNAQLYRQEQEARALAEEARALAEQADRIKTTLLANVSHELRTPLNVILGYSRGAIDSLAHGDPAAVDLSAHLTQIYRSGEHLLRLINDLLDLSRAEIGELDLVPVRFDPRDLLEEVFRASAESFGAGGGVAWYLALPPTLPPIEADPARLRQILLNLLHNAHKFTERGAITLGAEVAGAELHLWVADTGPGIAPELREQLFEPFVSGRSGPWAREGIGLGLSITRRLVALHHGRLELESEQGRGSTFHVYLPCPVPRPAGLEANDAARRVLLLVGDSAALPAPLVQLAARRGLSLHTLRSNDNLNEVLQTIRPALLAWDAASFAGEGWRAIEELRRRPELRQLPVMIYGGAADAALDTGGVATGVLLKPLGDDVLLDALSDLDPNAPDGSILIVEDDPNVRAQHRRLIAQHFPGYSVRDVGDGREALAAIASKPPSLIVLDLVIPELDGFAVLETLRADRRTASIPVLVLSGKILTGEDIRRLSEARVIFQTKNMLSHDELAESLRRAIDADERLPLQTSTLVKQAIAFIQQQHAEPLSRQAIADAVGINKDYLGRIFQQEVGISPWEYLIRYRLLQAKALLSETDLNITEVAVRVGFETRTYFSQVFSREVGCTPREYRARHRL